MGYDAEIKAFTTTWSFNVKDHEVEGTYYHKQLDPENPTGWKKGDLILVRSVKSGRDYLLRFITEGRPITREKYAESQYNRIKRWKFSADYQIEKRDIKTVGSKKRYISPALRKEVVERQNNHCQLCGDAFNEKNAFQIDHKIEVARGGLTVSENLQALCKNSCHEIKSLAFLKLKNRQASGLFDWRLQQKDILFEVIEKVNQVAGSRE